ncbi:DNA repair protein RecN [Myxococcota bacterium]|nr:DNA repair protein RecN [Myxococcota bacterium]
MLTHLRIENIALVDHIELELGRGLNVLTGETGAGKSVLVNSLSLVLGGRASTDVIRTGAQEAVVEALFEVPEGLGVEERLEERGIECEDGELVVRRVVSRSGKGKVSLNGQLVTVAMLSEIVRDIADITGQHEHVSLLDPERHLDIVDAYGELQQLGRTLAASHADVLGYKAALDALVLDEAEKARREDYLRFSLDEIVAIDPKVGEIEALELERKRLRNVAELADGVRKAEGALYSDDGAIVEVVGRVQNELMRLARLDDRLQSLSGSASSALAELEELARQLGRYQGALSADPERLGELEERLEALKKLARKHGGTIEAVLAAKKAMAEELESLEHEEARRADLASLLEAETERRKVHALALSAARHKVVRSLEIAVQSELAQLCMEKTTFRVELVPLPEIGPRGAESAEIMISPNTGEPARPLRKIASGGELSRVLLAIKHVLANRNFVGTYVFDEIDTGIGGAVADVLGKKLRDVARSHQVICITHSPQVAAHGDVHLRVRKSEEGGRTTTKVEVLDERERVEELARMLGGVAITEKTRGLAREMLGRSAERVASVDVKSAKVDAKPDRKPEAPKNGKASEVKAADKNGDAKAADKNGDAKAGKAGDAKGRGKRAGA